MKAKRRTEMEGIDFYSDNANAHNKTHVAFEVIFKKEIVCRIGNCGAEKEIYIVACDLEYLKIFAAAYGM